MIEINLLPKSYLKGSRSFSLGKVGIYVIAAAAGVMLMLTAVTFYQIHQLNQLEENIVRANQRAALLQKDIELVDALTDIKDKITNRMVAVEKLDRYRSVWVRILEDVSRNIPEFTWLAVYAEKFGSDREKAFNFVLGCNAHYLSDEELQKMVAQAAAGSTQDSKTTHKELN